SLYTYFGGDQFNSAPNPILQKNPEWAANANGAKKLDQPYEFYYPMKDHSRTVTPGFTLGGYILKDRIWIFGAPAPECKTLGRFVNMAASSPTPGPHTFNRNTNTYYSMSRMDVMATQKIRLYGSWQYGYQRATGTSLPTLADDVHGQFNTNATGN